MSVTNLRAALAAAQNDSDILNWKSCVSGIVRRMFHPAAQKLTRTPYDPARPLGFMHVPKTAGTSLIRALAEALQPRRMFGGFDHSLFGDFRDFASIAAHVSRDICTTDALAADADLIAGHVALSSLRAWRPAAQLITVLREPIGRVLSHWLFWRAHSDELLEPWGTWGDRVRLARLPLAGFLGAPGAACQTDNQATRMLLWPHPLIPNDGFIDPRHDRRLLAEARARLATFALVDCIENPGFADTMQGWLGRPFGIETHNATGRLPEPLRGDLDAELTPEAIALVMARSRLDLHLWRDAVRFAMPDRDAADVRQRALEENLHRHAALLAA